MNQHLLSCEITEWTLGERPPEIQRHLNACSACRERLTGLNQTLAAFRASASEWSRRERKPDFHLRPALADFRTRLLLHNFCWTLTAVAVCLLVSFSVPLSRNPPVAIDPLTDSQVLTQIDAELSRGVPRSMEPLLNLVSIRNE
jgi:predicted anti-sigma-YlaC factor YlaD